ncbi:hypothetical protein [Luteibacter sp. SG786]|uniref:hypothetical protein n=1 Tax=Luteibacter sp. SG786 TaxID=2587130 RepID=UPI0014205FC6|nr:hypothetical protein [Luteibacter sp. SG786]NII56112.1 hypothetical protein [Luteibacter sp. SG786]
MKWDDNKKLTVGASAILLCVTLFEIVLDLSRARTRQAETALVPPIVQPAEHPTSLVSQALRARMVAMKFTGFYIANTEEYPTICRDEGVDISEYAALFRKEHERLYRKASVAFQADGLERDEFAKLERSKQMKSRALARESLRTFASDTKDASVKDGCLAIAAHPQRVAEKELFSSTILDSVDR